MRITPELIQTLITFIVGGGLVTLITQSGKVVRSVRSGARASTRDVIRDLAAARDESEDREADRRRDAVYWANIAAGYGYQLRQHGLVPDPEHPMSPSERQREQDRRSRRPTLRQRRADQAPTTEEIRRVIDDDHA